MAGAGVAAFINHFWVHFFILISLFAIHSRSDQEDTCVYTVYIKTGSIVKGGTDSSISLALYDADGQGIRIKNIEAWGGVMGPDYDYFERGNLDIFTGRGPCLNGPVCAMNLTSDGTGSHPGWYCKYVEVTSTGIHKPCARKFFSVEQWLATDAPPYELTATRNNCRNKTEIGRFESSPVVSVV